MTETEAVEEVEEDVSLLNRKHVASIIVAIIIMSVGSVGTGGVMFVKFNLSEAKAQDVLEREKEADDAQQADATEQRKIITQAVTKLTELGEAQGKSLTKIEKHLLYQDCLRENANDANECVTILLK